MPTRRQDPETQRFRQDAFSSSAEFERGILANLVAARCQRLSDPRTIGILWWLQQVSWREGGLEKFATEFLSAHQHLVGTPSMHEFGQRTGQVYNANQVRKVRGEFRLANACSRGSFLLKDERLLADELAEQARRIAGVASNEDFGAPARVVYPTTYPAQKFRDRCKMEATGLADLLKGMLVDPRSDVEAGLWNMPGLFTALCAFRECEAASAAGHVVQTEITRRVFEELDFALESRSFVLIEGREGIGKSHAAVNWCEQHPGQAVYIRLESGTDETSFFRSVARAIGTACSYGRKTVEMRARIQDTLQAGHLILCIDEAHFLWPQSDRSHRSAPMKVEWLRTALVDFNVPVALISTPQYFKRACARFQKGGWNSLQVQRRLTRTVVLPIPEELPKADILKVVMQHFPDADRITRGRIVALAIGTVGFLTTIVHIRKRMDFLKSRRPGVAESDVLTEAMHDMGLPKAADVDTTAATTKPTKPTQPAKEALSPPQRGITLPSGTRLLGEGRLIPQPEQTIA